mgnify:CR=1 FL=1|tara:strand:- start:618 stop:1202 length:585 start_codon:yes stop_codon:yes gene_type:complete
MIIFDPGHNNHILNYNYVDGVFPDDLLKEVQLKLRSYELFEAEVGDGGANERVRKSKVRFISPSDLGDGFVSRVIETLKEVNDRVFKFDLTGLVEEFQYTTYDASYQGKYDWHFDEGSSDKSWTRKISMILILSDPDAYEGGELEIVTEEGIHPIEQKLGRIIFFPSFLRHKVNPVTKGSRESLVLWASGAAFR